jgi:hypothetical protein
VPKLNADVCRNPARQKWAGTSKGEKRKTFGQKAMENLEELQEMWVIDKNLLAVL